MYYIEKIKLTHFKNYASIELEFHSKWNAILGYNGMGKTNLLDAIYYTCLGKSYFSSGDKNVVNHQSEFFRIETGIHINGVKEKFINKTIPGSMKEISIDGKKIPNISHHVGRYPCIVVAPNDIHILLEGSEDRRNFLNQSLIQCDKLYIENLIYYNKVLRQRNALLKSFLDGQRFDKTLLEGISRQLLEPAQYIFEKRKHLVSEISPMFSDIYQKIAGGQEICSISYNSNLLESDYSMLLEKHQEKDRILGRTTTGIHKDDMHFIMNDESLKTYGSQGQLKSFVLALKLSQFYKLKEATGKSPILLLDDLFDKLDEKRVAYLLEILHSDDFGQVFITDKDRSTIPLLLDEISTKYRIFAIHEGTLEHSEEK